MKLYKPKVYRVVPRTQYRPRTATEEIAAIDTGQPPDVEAHSPPPSTTWQRLKQMWLAYVGR